MVIEIYDNGERKNAESARKTPEAGRLIVDFLTDSPPAGENIDKPISVQDRWCNQLDIY